MKYKVLITIFYFISADQSFDKISNNIWSVLFVINKYDLFLNQIQNLMHHNFENIKIIKNFEQIDDEINFQLQNHEHPKARVAVYRGKCPMPRHEAQTPPCSHQ